MLYRSKTDALINCPGYGVDAIASYYLHCLFNLKLNY